MRDVRVYQRRDLDPQSGTLPAGLTTQVGFIRLAYLKRPKSGKPDFGWSIIFRKNFLRRRWMAGSSPAMTGARPLQSLQSPAGLTTQVGFIRLAHVKRPKSGKPDFGWSIVFARPFLPSGWIGPRVKPAGVKPGNDDGGSSPAMTGRELIGQSHRKGHASPDSSRE
jgi:hypothetical protein